LDVSPLQNIKTTSIPKVRTDFQALATSMNNLKSSVTVSMLTISGSPTAAEQNQALADFKAAVDAITTKITEMTIVTPPGSLETIAVAADGLANSILSVKATAQSLIVILY
jgi:hypothetical protein